MSRSLNGRCCEWVPFLSPHSAKDLPQKAAALIQYQATMVSNAEIEMRWVKAWNDLYDIAADRTDFPCLLPDGKVVDINTCKAWLQDAIYKESLVQVRSGWGLGQRSAIVCKLSQV